MISNRPVWYQLHMRWFLNLAGSYTIDAGMITEFEHQNLLALSISWNCVCVCVCYDQEMILFCIQS